MVIINKRELSKIKTRKNILGKTESILLVNGLLKTSSKMIANECEVSQGTIFLHFGTKEQLFYELLNSNIVELENALISKCDPLENPIEFVKGLLVVLSKYEDFLSRLYKDENYLSEDMRKLIDGVENIVKNLLLENYRNNSKKRLSIVDSFVIIDAFLSQIRNYLFHKDLNLRSVSVIKQRRGRILKLYGLLFKY